VASCLWRLDKPVSNSGRLQTILRELAAANGWDWSVTLDADPDGALSTTEKLVATADSVILDRCGRWCNLARDVVKRSIADANVISLSG
jgi:hypothetical protein